MPVNSFEDYPMSWKPSRGKLSFPLYLSLAALLEQDILSGKLPPNTKLPPQRELADFLDLNLSTVTRAFKQCEMQNLIYGTVGKGTFVSPNAALPYPEMRAVEQMIDLGAVEPYYGVNTMALTAACKVLSKTDADTLFAYESNFANLRHKQIAQRWLSGISVCAPTEQIFIAGGAQNALAAALLCAFRPGDRIAADIYTYANFLQLAKRFRLQLVPIEGDAQGMLPQAFEKQARLLDLKGVYLMPSCANPTGIVMSETRKKELVHIFSQKEIIVLEDDPYSSLISKTCTPIFSLLPKQTIYIQSLSKGLCAGLRTAYLVCPEAMQDCFRQTLVDLDLQVSPVNAALASALICDGTAQKMIRRKRTLAKQRNQIYKMYFPESTSPNPYSFIQWLPLSEMRGYVLEQLAYAHGVKVLGGERFAVGNTENCAGVRIATCTPQTVDALETGLKILKALV